MATMKILFLALFAIAAAQAEFPAKIAEQLGVRRDIFTAILEQARNIDKFINDSEQFQALRKEAQEIIKQAESSLREAYKNAEASLNKQIGLRVCNEDQNEQIKQLISELAEKNQACYKDLTTELKQVYDQLVSDFEKINEELLVLIDDMDKCTDLKCKSQKFMLIIEKSWEINHKVGDKIIEARNIIRKHQAAMKECTSKNNEEYSAKINAILEQCNSQ